MRVHADNDHGPAIRCRLPQGGGAAGLGLTAASWLGRTSKAFALVRQPDGAGAPAPEQLHVQFGADAASEAAVSWVTAERVARPSLRLGRPGHGHGTAAEAEERPYTDALTGETVWTYHAGLDNLQPDTPYTYQVNHDGAPAPEAGRLRTGPVGRSKPFRFTSYGDQAIRAPVGQGLGPWSPNAGYIVPALETFDPLFHLLNGDLCYANRSDAPVDTWSSFFRTNATSARNRPWMPCCGNHENEVGNGPDGYLAYQTRFALPDNGAGPDQRGNWYSFRVGNVWVISLNNDDVCLQDEAFSAYRRDHVPGYATRRLDPYIRGYSGGAQKAFLERALAHANAEPEIDWIVVCMHQVAMSSAPFDGADLGIRQEWLPLFDRYGVDLVVAGHEHHFERTFPVRGVRAGAGDLLTPQAQGSDPVDIDTSAGAVHMIIGGGGYPGVTPAAAVDAPHDGLVIYDVGPGDPSRQRPALTSTEPGDWSAYRDLSTPYGFAVFDIDPHARPGTTTITVRHFGAAAGSADYRLLDTFTLRRPYRHPRLRPLDGATAAAP